MPYNWDIISTIGSWRLCVAAKYVICIENGIMEIDFIKM